MMFDPKTFKYYKSVYLQHAPTKMFTWKQAWGDALYWVTRGNSSDSSYLWFWDLKNHIGDSTPTYLQISATGCMGSICRSPLLDLAFLPNKDSLGQRLFLHYCLLSKLETDIGPSIFTQLLGQYAAIPLVACAGANPIGGYVILELFASHGTRAITSINKINTQKQLRLGISLPGSSETLPFFRLRSAISHTNAHPMRHSAALFWFLDHRARQHTRNHVSLV
jgi:hypothetical protein